MKKLLFSLAFFLHCGFSVFATNGNANDGSLHTIKLEVIGNNWSYVKSFEYYDGTTWTIIDHNDASISYSGFAYKTVAHESSVTGSWAQFTFTGTAIRLNSLGTYATYGGTGKIYIDGVYKKTITFKTSDKTVYELYFDVAVSSVEVSPTTKSINVYESTKLTATVLPSIASNPAISWSSSNIAIATVDEKGLVTGVAAGNATITATSQEGAKTGTSLITVVANPNVHTIKLEVKQYWNWLDSFEYFNGETWTTIDDNDATIIYSGFNLKNGKHESDVPGSLAQLTFTGTGIRMNGAISNMGGEGRIWIDGVYQILISFNTSKTSSTLLFEKTGLSGGTTDLEPAGTDPSMLFYPNPASDFITININNGLNNEQAHVTITDLLGKKVYNSVLVNGYKSQINTSSFTKGVYIVTIRKGTEQYTKKLIVD